MINIELNCSQLSIRPVITKFLLESNFMYNSWIKYHQHVQCLLLHPNSSLQLTYYNLSGFLVKTKFSLGLTRDII